MFLNCHSYYSLRYGTISMEDLVEEGVKAYGLAEGPGALRMRDLLHRDVAPAMALTDINNTTGVMDFVAACRERGIKPIAGIEFRRDDQLLYTCLARNNAGFRALNEFLSHHNIGNIPLPDVLPVMEDVFVIHPLGNSEMNRHRSYPRYYGSKIACPTPGNLIGIRPSELSPLMLSRHRDLIPAMVLMAPVTFRNQREYELHRNFRAVDHNVLLTRLEPHQVASSDEVALSVEAMLELCRDFPEIVNNTLNLMESCSIEFDFKSCKNKKSFTGTRYDDLVLLEKLALDGIQYRYGKGHGEAMKRVKHELAIIDKMGFSAYFLIAWDIVRYSMSRAFYHVGRGSGANSIVAYCLRITDVDPIELDLYFERFINPKRTSPPDFDIDYSWKERDEVIDYIFRTCGAFMPAGYLFRKSRLPATPHSNRRRCYMDECRDLCYHIVKCMQLYTCFGFTELGPPKYV